MNRGLLFVFIAAALCSRIGSVHAEPCALPTASTGTVAAVRDGRTFMLTDGREVRLAGIETSGRNADALRTLADGQILQLRSAPGADRYGRVVAYAALPGSPQTIQEALLAQGEALVSARIGEKTCAEALFAAEKAARAAKRGLWADPNFAPVSSENLAATSPSRSLNASNAHLLPPASM